jgi:hypothetical protein
MKKTVTVHAMWRSGGTAFSWAIASAYGKSLVCEPLFHPDHVLEIPRFELNEFISDRGMHRPEDLIRLLGRLRYCPSGRIEEKPLFAARDFMSLVMERVPNAGVIKMIGVEEIGEFLAFGDDLRIYQNRSFLQQTGSMLRLQWRVDSLIREHVNPEAFGINQDSGLREALEMIRYLPLKNDIIKGSAQLWLIHAYQSSKLESEGRGKMFWVNDYDRTAMADLIREHLGPETEGDLVENLVKPKGWVPNLESMGGTVDSWWRPEDEISYEQLVPQATLLAEELRKQGDPIVVGLAERVI